MSFNSIRLDRRGGHVTAALLMLLLAAGFYWKLVLTRQYSWLQSPDIAYQVLPWYEFQAREWHAGRVPLWDPNLWGGQPLIGQAQPGVAYPLNWLLFKLPLKDGYIRESHLNLYYMLIRWMAAFFAYLLCRSLRCGPWAAIIGGSLYGFGGYMGAVDHPQMVNGAVWTPLVFLYLLRAVRGESPYLSAALSGFFLGVAWLSGHHQIPIFVSLATGAVWIYFTVRERSLHIAKLAVVAGVFTFCAGAVQILPAYEYGHLAHRWAGAPEPLDWKSTVPYNVHGQYSTTPLSILGVVIPGVYKHTNTFQGIVAFSLAILGVALMWRERSARLFALIAAGGWLLALGNSSLFHGVIYALLPVVEKARAPSNAVHLFHFGAAVLAALGVDALRNSTDSPWWRRVERGVVTAALIMLITVFGFVVGKGIVPDDRIVLSGVFGLVFAALLYGLRKGNLGYPVFSASILLLMLTELANVYTATWPNKAEPDRNKIAPVVSQHEDIRDFLRRDPLARVQVDDEQVPYNFGDFHGVQQVGGYVASVTSNIYEMASWIPKMRQILGVKYSVRKTPENPSQAVVLTGKSGLNVYLNEGVQPRAWAVHAVTGVATRREALSTIEQPGFDVSRQAVVAGAAPAIDGCSGSDEVRVAGYTSNQVLIDAKMACRGLVILADVWYPGWKADVDGQRAPIFEVDGCVRGVMVPGGAHHIEMRYRPTSVYAGAGLTVLSLLAVCTMTLRRRV